MIDNHNNNKYNEGGGDGGDLVNVDAVAEREEYGLTCSRFTFTWMNLIVGPSHR